MTRGSGHQDTAVGEPGGAWPCCARPVGERWASNCHRNADRPKPEAMHSDSIKDRPDMRGVEHDSPGRFCAGTAG